MRELFSWFKGAMVGISLEIYHYLLSKIRRQKLELDDRDLKAELSENEKSEHEKHDQLSSDSDTASRIVNSAIDRGRRASPSANGSFRTCYGPEEQQSLAKYLIRCQRHEDDLKSYKKAYTECLTTPSAADSWWQNPYVIVGGMALSLSTGILLALALK